MISVVVAEKTPNEIIDIVKALKQQGLLVGKDFDFAYQPSEYDYMTGYTKNRQTKFTFYDKKLATWFALRWAS